jgi:hypothetical protein
LSKRFSLWIPTKRFAIQANDVAEFILLIIATVCIAVANKTHIDRETDAISNLKVIVGKTYLKQELQLLYCF